MSLQEAPVATPPVAPSPASPPAPAPAAKASPAPAKAPPVADPKPAAAVPPAPAPTETAPPARVSTSTSIFDDEDDDAEAPAAEAAPKEGETAETGEPKEGASAEGFQPPDNWRELIAKGDEKHLSELKRFASFDTWVKSQRALRQKVSSGEYKKTDAWSDDWDDARKAEYRKENGIPEKATDYQLPEVPGKTWDDKEKAALTPFLERLHARNASPAVVQETLQFYGEALALAAEQKTARDREDKITLEDTLRPEWGADYRANVNLMKRALADADILPGGGEGLGKALLNARLDDGRRLINMPEMAQFLAGLARDHYGEGGMLPSVEVKEMEGRESEILKIMRQDINRYYREKNAKGQTLQDELAEIRARRTGKKKAA